MYPFPFAPYGYRALDENVLWRGGAELGAIADGERTGQAYWDQYVDRGPRILLNDFSLDLFHPESGAFVHTDGGSAGRDDQFYRFEAGVFGWLRVHGQFDEVPHRLMNDAKSIFEGVGTQELRLPTPLVPAANTEAEIDAVLADLPFQTLSVDRERGRVGIEGKPLRILRLFAEYRHEDRKGERPFGSSLGFAFFFPGVGSVIETVEPIEYQTQDFTIGAQVLHRRVQLNLTYHASFFDNDNEFLLWENPFMAGGSEVGQAALAPDNKWHNLKADLGLTLPLSGRLTSSVSWGVAKQDEELLPPTVNPLAIDWLDETALGQLQAQAEFTTFLSHSRLQFRPFRQIQLKGDIRYFRRRNETDYTAYNPTLDFYGYIPEDAFRGVVGPFATVPRFKSVPYGYTKWNAKAGAVLRPGWRTTFDLEFERERIKRDHRVRDHTTEDRYRIAATNRGLWFATIRLSYEYANKKGDDIDPTRDFSFYTGGPAFFALPIPIISGTPLRSLAEHRQFDLANRRQNIIKARINAAIGDVGDTSASGRYFENDYGARYGLNFDRGHDLNVEFAFLPSPKFSATAFASVEERRRQIRAINGVAFRSPFSFFDPNSTTIDTFDPLDFSVGFPAFPQPGFPFFLMPTLAVFPFENAWKMDAEMTTWVFGIDIETTLWERIDFDFHYSFQHSNEQRDYWFDTVGALSPGLTADEAGNNFPDLKNTDHILGASLLYELNEMWAVRFFYRYQYSTIDHVQRQGLEPRLGHVPDDFSASIFGSTLRFRF